MLQLYWEGDNGRGVAIHVNKKAAAVILSSRTYNNSCDLQFKMAAPTVNHGAPTVSFSASRPGEGKSPLRAQYFTRKRSSQISTHDLPMEKNAIGLLSPTGIFFSSVKLTVPLAYVYIVLILWRELCFSFPETMLNGQFVTAYFSLGVWTARTMRSSSLVVEVWAVIEGMFYVILFLHRKWLNSLDTLELSLLSAPMLETRERSELWDLMMDSMDLEDKECSKFISGWFFGESLEKLTRYDIMDYLTWSLFEGRSMEHLTQEEMQQLRGFVTDLEYRVSMELYGVEEEDDGSGGGDKKMSDGNIGLSLDSDGSLLQQVKSDDVIDEKEELHHSHSLPVKQNHIQNYGTRLRGFSDGSIRLKRNDKKARPRDIFQFQDGRDSSHHSYFSNLYESYKVWCEQYREMNFHPVQGIRDYVAGKRQSLIHAEQAAVATASESLSNIQRRTSKEIGHLYENAYFTLIEKDGVIDKQLTALSHATQSQIGNAWNSIWKMKERLHTASDISERRKALQQQLKSYRQTLAQMRRMATAVPSRQMADLMRKITQCYEALEGVERSAMDAFIQVTGYVGKTLLHSKEPPRYLK